METDIFNRLMKNGRCKNSLMNWTVVVGGAEWSIHKWEENHEASLSWGRHLIWRQVNLPLDKYFSRQAEISQTVDNSGG